MGLFKSGGTLTRRKGRSAAATKDVKPTYLAATESELSVPEKFEIHNLAKDAPVPEQIPSGEARCEIQCTFVGDSGSGKTTLVKAMGKKERTRADAGAAESEIFERYCARVTSRSGEKVNVKYCKASADEKHSRMRALSYQVTDVFFLCFSTTDRSSFESAKLEWFAEIDHLSPDAPVYLIGTKCDLRDAAMDGGSAKGFVTAGEASQLAEEINAIKYIETQVNERKDALMPIIKEVAEAVLRQFEHQRRLAEINEEYAEDDTNEFSANAQTKKYASIRRKTRQAKKKCTPMSPKDDHKKSVRLSGRKRKQSFAVLTSSKRDFIAPQAENDDIIAERPRRRTREPLQQKNEQVEVAAQPAKKKTRVSIMDEDIYEAPALDFCAIPEGDSLADSAAVAKDMPEHKEVPATNAAEEETPRVRVSLKKLKQTLQKVARRTSARFQPILTRTVSATGAPFPNVPLYTASCVNVAVGPASESAASEQAPATADSPAEVCRADAVAIAPPAKVVFTDSAPDEDADMEDVDMEDASAPADDGADDEDHQCDDNTGDDKEDEDGDDDEDDDDDDYDESDEEAVFCNW
mmetsp:Transcript_2036/g.7366  ORF Transcript_2036/g.7366 Transcript_2036/m.7366 type:complete len:579 (-) Transcript_2036:39-1775(-)